MTSPHSRALPPLTNLPAPRVLPRESPSLVPPDAIMVESKGLLRRRLLRRSWAPGLVILGLWYALLGLYVLGASPTFWFLSALVALGEPTYLRAATVQLGFSRSGLATAFGLLPLAGTVLSLAMMQLAPSAIAGMDPRRHLSERGFQREVATRITAILLAPPLLVLLALPLSVVLGLKQPWSALGAGPLMALTLGAGAIMLAWVLVRRTLAVPTLLGVPDAGEVETAGRLDRDPAVRLAAAKKVLAQDRRHLPPNPGTAARSGAFSPRGLLTALVRIARACLVWVAPTAVGLGWLLFGTADAINTFGGMLETNLVEIRSALRWPVLAVGLPLLGLVAVGLAFLPGLAVLAAEGQRAEVVDQRTYATWPERARVNPWEARVVTLTGVFSAVLGLLGLLTGTVLLVLLGETTPLVWSGLVAIALVLVPLLGVGATAAMRTGLRDVLYGPAGDYTRRETPYALIAPDIGTRTQRGQDPAVRAEMRRRLQAEGAGQGVALLDVDVAGERLWMDDSAPGATDAAVREADLGRGRLPDFGGEGSPFTRGADGAGGSGGYGAGGYRAGDDAYFDGARSGGSRSDGSRADESHRHPIPDSITGLREP